ncbi:hypothetical protein VNO77_29680 [Canavalia gladiata]|uniref:Transcription factor CBF/NF-Y/archaeal histone domain-containing protein n=1 Tax=Canavalia gladiata TaxID=3824 RepID=A0AAN9Q119_CANGL
MFPFFISFIYEHVQGEGNSYGDENKKEAVQPPPAAETREQNPNLPMTCLVRLMRLVLPSHVKITEETKETVMECVSEFISFITGEANEHCQIERRRTILAEDVIYAMSKLGFEKYIELLTVYLLRYRHQQQDATRRSTHVRYQLPASTIVTGFPVIPSVLGPFTGPIGMGGLINSGSSAGGSSAGGSSAGGSTADGSTADGSGSASHVYYDPFAYFPKGNNSSFRK